MPTVNLFSANVADTMSRLDRFDSSQVWVAKLGEAEGVGPTKADALRTLAAELDKREVLAADSGDA